MQKFLKVVVTTLVLGVFAAPALAGGWGDGQTTISSFGGQQASQMPEIEGAPQPWNPVGRPGQSSPGSPGQFDRHPVQPTPRYDELGPGHCRINDCSRGGHRSWDPHPQPIRPPWATHPTPVHPIVPGGGDRFFGN